MTIDSDIVVDLRRATDGDDAAWQRLCTRFQPVLRRLAADFEGLNCPDLSSSDLVQEAWLRVCKGLNQFHVDEPSSEEETAAKFYHWVRTTSRRAMLNICAARNSRARKPTGRFVPLGSADSTCSLPQSVEPVARENSPSGIAEKAEQSQRIEKAVGQISETTDRAIIQMVFMDGISLRCVSEILGLGYDQVRRRFHATLRQLETSLSEES